MNNNLTLSVTLTGDGRQLSGTLKDAQGDVREFSATTERESKKAETALTAPGHSAETVSKHLREAQQEARSFGSETTQGGRQAVQALTQTSRETQTTTAHLDKMRGVILSAGTALVAAFGAGSIINRAGLINDAEALAKSIGIATGELQAWDYAAQRTGLSGGAIGDIFKDVSDKLGDFAATGGGEAADLFENLNLQIGELQRLSPDQQLLKIADAISQIEDPSQRIFYLESLANDATRLLPLLEDNAAGLRELTDEAYAMGVAMDQVDIDNALEADRAMAQLRGTTDGFLNLLAADLGPALADTVGNLTELIQSAGGADQVLRTVTNTVTVVGAAAGAYGTYRAVIASATVAQWAFNTAVRANPLGIAITLLGAAAGAMFAYRDEVTLAGKESFQTSLDVDGLTSSFHLLTEAQQENKRASLTADLIDMRVEAGRLGSELVEVSRKVRNSGQLTPEGGALPIATPEDIQQGRELRQELARLLNNIEDGTELLGKYDQAMEALGESSRSTTTRTRTLAEANAEASKAAQELSQSTKAQTDALEDLYNRLVPGRKETVQLARDMQTLTLAIAMGTGNIAQNIQMMGLLQQQYIDAQKDTEDLADQTVKAAYTMEGAFDELRLNGLRRLDDGFADLWQGAIDGSRSASETMKRVLDQTLAELAHMAFTRPIIVEMQGMMGMGGGQQGDMNSQGMSLQNINPGMLQRGWETASGWFGGASTTSAGYAADSWAGSATGSYTGWAGDASSAAASQSVPIGGGGMMTGVYSAGAGIAGGWAGSEAGSAITGKTANSNYGQMIGTAVGTYIFPVVGTAIGSFVGSFADSLFGSGKKNYNFDFEQGGHYGIFGDRESQLGQFGITSFSDYKLGEQQDQLQVLMDEIAVFDNVLASAAIDERINAMRQSVEGFSYSGPEGLFDARLREIIDGSGAYVEKAIAAIADPEQMANAFLSVLNLERITQSLNAQIQSDVVGHLEANTGDIQGTAGSLAQAIDATVLLGNSAERLSLQFDTTAGGAIHYAWALQEAVGGLENLSNLQGSYYQNYFTAAEREANLRDDLTQSMQALGFELPKTRQGFRELAEAQDLNTTAGAHNYAALLQLEGAFAQLAPAIEKTETAVNNAGEALRVREQLERQLLQAQGNTDAIRQLEIDRLGDLETAEVDNLAALQRRIWAIEDEKVAQQAVERAQQDRIRAIENEAKAWSRAREQLASFSNSINGWIDNLRGTQAGLASPGDQLAASSQAFYEQYDKAKGGDRDAMNSITQYADRFIEAQKGWSASGSQTTATIDKVTGMLSKLPEQLSAEQFLAEEFRNSLDDQTTALQAALDLNGDGTISAIERAITSNWDTNDLLKGVLHQEMERLGTTVLTEAQIRAALKPYATDAEIDRLIGRVDKNGDGFITQQELTNARIGGLSLGIAGSLAGHFNMLDENLDGKLTFGELQRGLTGIATDKELRLIMKAVDLSGDGVISQLESQTVAAFTQTDLLNSVIQSEMRRLGTDQLTAAQVRAALAPHATDDEITRLIKRVDANGNGMINTQELTNARIGGLASGFANAIANEFDRIDINASGLIDYNEFRRAFAGMATDSQLQRIFKTLDANGNGTISRLEAINASNRTISNLTGRVDTNTGQMDQRARNSHTGMRVTLTHGQPADVLRHMGWIFAQQTHEWSSRIGDRHAIQMRRQGIGNSGKAYWEGGYTGPGGKYQEAGTVHAGEIVWSQDDIARAGGVDTVEALRKGLAGPARMQLSMAELPPMPSFPLLNNNDVVEAVRDLKREVTYLRKENAQLQRESNKHLSAANNQRGAAAKGQISAIERSNKMLKRMEDDKRLEAAKR